MRQGSAERSVKPCHTRLLRRGLEAPSHENDVTTIRESTLSQTVVAKPNLSGAESGAVHEFDDIASRERLDADFTRLTNAWQKISVTDRSTLLALAETLAQRVGY